MVTEVKVEVKIETKLEEVPKKEEVILTKEV